MSKRKQSRSKSHDKGESNSKAAKNAGNYNWTWNQ